MWENWSYYVHYSSPAAWAENETNPLSSSLCVEMCFPLLLVQAEPCWPKAPHCVAQPYNLAMHSPNVAQRNYAFCTPPFLKCPCPCGAQVSATFPCWRDPLVASLKVHGGDCSLHDLFRGVVQKYISSSRRYDASDHRTMNICIHWSMRCLMLCEKRGFSRFWRHSYFCTYLTLWYKFL